MLKPYHLATLKQIALMGGLGEYVSLSSRELGRVLGVSQQSASQRILELLRAGLVVRDLAARRQRITLSPRGVEILRNEYADYQRIFEEIKQLTISGYVVSGLGEGAFYMRQKGYKEQFKKKLLYEPYEGTLNIKLRPSDLSKIAILAREEGLFISGFESGGRTFGDAKCFLARLRNIDCAVIMPLRSHHTDVVEVISKQHVRTALGLSDGDLVELSVTL